MTASLSSANRLRIVERLGRILAGHWFLTLLLLATLSSALVVRPAFAADPVVKITSPTEGEVIDGTEVTVTLDVGDLKLVPGAQAAQKSDLHVHYLLDVDPTPWLDGKRDIPTGDPNIVHSAATSHTFTNLKPGPHKVTVILTNADHIAIQPPVAPSVRFTVGGAISAGLPRAGGLPEGVLLAMALIGCSLVAGSLVARRL